MISFVSGGIGEFVESVEEQIRAQFDEYERIAAHNQLKVLNAFWDIGVSPRHFAPSTGYGYGDDGREALEAVFAKVMGTEAAIVRTQIASGTHALSLTLNSLLNSGDRMVCATSRPYDTLGEVVGYRGDNPLSLVNRGVDYVEVPLRPDDSIDSGAVISALESGARVVYFQRSRGYAWREAIALSDIQDTIVHAREIAPDAIMVVDNCYGEFVCEHEPSELGADVVVGSLIKNPGGGLAPTGGYVCSSKALIDMIGQRMTAPGLGLEVGSNAAGYLPYFQGIYLAPHVVCQSLKTATLFAAAFERLGHAVLPRWDSKRSDIVQSVRMGDQDALLAFCRAIQAASPVDAFVTPMPWDMPGYSDQVIMAAGTFIQGASIELSADAPLREPYNVYFQGGLTYEHGRIAVMKTISELQHKLPEHS